MYSAQMKRTQQLRDMALKNGLRLHKQVRGRDQDVWKLCRSHNKEFVVGGMTLDEIEAYLIKRFG